MLIWTNANAKQRYCCNSKQDWKNFPVLDCRIRYDWFDRVKIKQLQLISLIDLVDLIDMGKLALIWTSLNQKQKTLKMNLGKDSEKSKSGS